MTASMTAWLLQCEWPSSAGAGGAFLRGRGTCWSHTLHWVEPSYIAASHTDCKGHPTGRSGGPFPAVAWLLPFLLGALHEGMERIMICHTTMRLLAATVWHMHLQAELRLPFTTTKGIVLSRV